MTIEEFQAEQERTGQVPPGYYSLAPSRWNWHAPAPGDRFIDRNYLMWQRRADLTWEQIEK